MTKEKQFIPTTENFWENVSGNLPITLTNDYMFRAVFQSSQNSLLHLLSALLKIPTEQMVSCHIENPIVLGENIHLCIENTS